MICCVFKQKTAYEMRISDWSSDVCSSDLMLLSLQLIVQASAPLRESQVFGVLVEPLSHEILLVVLAGAMLTWAAHSSVAIVLLIMSLAGSGVLPIQLALALVLGDRKSVV